ncbi:MAG: methyl-accepting chemotaxis protein [Lachnospiraceae bacterium]|nr:methyl-accepting chemotaxis protein [Lachnospiraceae bacterium]MDY5521151.1 methyl-accepting chemotaxis protein [Agathobacter sp.]
MKKKKTVKLYTKLLAAFLAIDICMIITLIFSRNSMHNILSMQNPEHYLRSFDIYTVVMFVVLMSIMTFLCITIPKALRKGSEEVTEATKKIAAGEVDVTLEKYKNDEFGAIIDEYQTVIDNTRYLAEIADKVADGNLMVNVMPRSNADVLGNALKTLVDRNHHALSNINDAAYQVMTSASQVASASESLAQGSTEQASAIEQITASISEIAQKTKQNAGQATEASELMSNALEDVKQGNVQMQDLMAAMEEINKASESISKIIKVIDDIAFQTNILALNAAVEAARAGEAGKGFAVVAEEVRNLAAKSAAAAAETAELIEDSMHKVEAGSKIADDTAQALDAITRDVSQSEGMIREIADSSNYQATAVAQINQAIGQVSQVVQTNSATSEQCAAAAEELSNQAIRMRELLSVYHLGNGTDSYEGIPQNGSVHKSPVEEVDRTAEPIISLGEDFGKY